MVKKSQNLQEFGMLPGNGHEGTSWGDGSVLDLGRGVGYMGVCICRNIKLYTQDVYISLPINFIFQ